MTEIIKGMDSTVRISESDAEVEICVPMLIIMDNMPRHDIVYEQPLVFHLSSADARRAMINYLEATVAEISQIIRAMRK